MTQTNLKRIQDLYAAFARGDGPAILGAMDPAIVWNEAENFPLADRNPYIGPAAVGEGVFGRLASQWTDFKAIPAEMVDGGDTIVALGRYTGKFNATGRSVDAQFVHVWGISAGKINRFQQYTDTAQVQRATQA